MIRPARAAVLAALLCAGFSVSRAEPFGFPLKNVDGDKPVALSSFKGKLVLIELWRTDCGPCRTWRPFFEKLQARFGARGLVVLSVDSAEEEGVVRDYLKAHPTPLRNFLDPKGKVLDALKTQGVPTMALIDKDGYLIWMANGFGPSTADELTWRIDREMPILAELPLVKP